MAKRCNNCKYAEISIGAYTNTIYLECGKEREAAEKMTLEELYYAVQHPDERKFCTYSNGEPKFVGVTHDD